MKCKSSSEKKLVGKANDLLKEITEQKKENALLQVNAFQYRALFEILPQKIFFKNKKAVYVSCNKHYAEDLGIKASEIAGRTDYDFHPKRLAEKYIKDDRRVMRLGRSEEIEEEYFKNKKQMWVRAVKVPLRDKSGKVAGLLGIFWDVTEEKMSREKEKESFCAAQECAKELRCLCDLSKIIEKPGISLEELFVGAVNLLCGAFQYPDDCRARIIFDGSEYKTANFKKTKQKLSVPIRIQKKKRGVVEVCYLMRKAKAEKNIFLNKEKALLDAVSERLGGAVERIALDKEVKVLMSRIEFILRVTKTGLDIVDSNFNIQYVDKEWAKIYGDSKGRKCYDYFMGHNVACARCGIPEALSTKKAVITEHFLPKEGNRPIQVSSIPFQDDQGEWMAAEINVDITERKKLEGDLRQTLKDWDNMFNAISDVVFITDRNFVIKKANFAFAESLNMDQEEIIGKKCYEVLHKLNQPFDGCPFEIVIESKLPYTKRIDDVNIGIPLLVSVSPIFNEKRDVIGSVHVARDIKRYQAELNSMVL